MKLYLIKRIDDSSYNEYEAFVVRALNESDALSLCRIAESGNDENIFKFYKGYLFTEENTKITELKQEGNAEIILGSYING